MLKQPGQPWGPVSESPSPGLNHCRTASKSFWAGTWNTALHFGHNVRINRCDTTPSKAFAIGGGKVEIAGQEASAKTDPAQQEVALRVKLPAGKTTLKAWFQDAQGNDVCGAFFAYVRLAQKLN